MDAVFIVLLTIATGAVVKIADYFADTGKKGLLGVALGIAYGLAIGYLCAATEASTIFLAAVLASALSGKIDKKEHFAGFMAMFFFLFIFGVSAVDVGLLAVFAIAAYIDEKKPLYGYRGVLDIVAVIIGILGFGWINAFFILAFDSGYVLASAAFPEKAVKAGAKRKVPGKKAP